MNITIEILFIETTYVRSKQYYPSKPNQNLPLPLTLSKIPISPYKQVSNRNQIPLFENSFHLPTNTLAYRFSTSYAREGSGPRAPAVLLFGTALQRCFDRVRHNGGLCAVAHVAVRMGSASVGKVVVFFRCCSECLGLFTH